MVYDMHTSLSCQCYSAVQRSTASTSACLDRHSVVSEVIEQCQDKLYPTGVGYQRELRVKDRVVYKVVVDGSVRFHWSPPRDYESGHRG